MQGLAQLGRMVFPRLLFRRDLLQGLVQLGPLLFYITLKGRSFRRELLQGLAQLGRMVFPRLLFRRNLLQRLA